MDVAEVYLWGTRIGAVMQTAVDSVPVFNYDEDFVSSGIEVSPIVMPLGKQAYSFPALSKESFHGLPGLIADSLPDKFGTILIEQYLAKQGRSIDALTAVERLLYTGKRGMGALEYRPQKNFAKVSDTSIDINALVELASEILTDREGLHISENEHTMEKIINVGTSAGGARAKAVIAWNRELHDIRSGQIEAGTGYEYWLIKFDGVSNNKDKGDKEDGPAYTRIEYAYHLMAKAAGIYMSECQLYKESGRYHFMTKRFDRTGSGEKLHMQTLGAVAHFDYNMPGAYSYEQAAVVMNRLNLGQKAVEQFYRRMVFNIIARNQDDHVKNISFLMDKSGTWSLSPAYDVTYAYDVSNRWLARHQMSVNGKLDNITIQDLYQSAAAMNINKGKAGRMIGEVSQAVDRWEEFAGQAELNEQKMAAVRNNFYLL